MNLPIPQANSWDLPSPAKVETTRGAQLDLMNLPDTQLDAQNWEQQFKDRDMKQLLQLAVPFVASPVLSLGPWKLLIYGLFLWFCHSSASPTTS